MAREESRATGQRARRFKELTWSTRKSWSRKRRVIAKAEWTQGEANPRFIVTSLTAADGDGRSLRRGLLRARQDGEPHHLAGDRFGRRRRWPPHVWRERQVAL